MNTMSFSLYRDTADFFYHDMLSLLRSGFTSTATGYTRLGGDTHLGKVGA